MAHWKGMSAAESVLMLQSAATLRRAVGLGDGTVMLGQLEQPKNLLRFVGDICKAETFVTSAE